MSNWFTRLFTGSAQNALEAPLAATVPDDWKNGSEAAYSGVSGHGEDWGLDDSTIPVVKPTNAGIMTDADVQAFLGGDRSGLRDKINEQYGNSLASLADAKPIFSGDHFSGEALVALMRR